MTVSGNREFQLEKKLCLFFTPPPVKRIFESNYFLRTKKQCRLDNITNSKFLKQTDSILSAVGLKLQVPLPEIQLQKMDPELQQKKNQPETEYLNRKFLRKF